MVIATWGGIRFKVSEKNTVPLKNIKLQSESSVAKHDAIARRQKIQWIEYNAGRLSVSIIFDSEVSKKPYEQYMRLQALEGYVSPFLIGNKRIGYHKWMLSSVNASFARIISKGAISRIEVDATFTEYYDDPEG
jgi:phage protein U